jgi:hypothetical protein
MTKLSLYVLLTLCSGFAHKFAHNENGSAWTACDALRMKYLLRLCRHPQVDSPRSVIRGSGRREFEESFEDRQLDSTTTSSRRRGTDSSGLPVVIDEKLIGALATQSAAREKERKRLEQENAGVDSLENEVNLMRKKEEGDSCNSNTSRAQEVTREHRSNESNGAERTRQKKKKKLLSLWLEHANRVETTTMGVPVEAAQLGDLTGIAI